MTLVEFLIALALSLLLVAVLVSVAATTSRNFAEMINYVDLDHVNRLAVDRLSKELRQVRGVDEFSTNSVMLTDFDGRKLYYEFDPRARTLTRRKNGSRWVVLNNCDALEFAIFQRKPVEGTFDFHATSTVTNAKAISVTWSCSRAILGIKANTESAQASKIVLRNKIN